MGQVRVTANGLVAVAGGVILMMYFGFVAFVGRAMASAIVGGAVLLFFGRSPAVGTSRSVGITRGLAAGLKAAAGMFAPFGPIGKIAVGAMIGGTISDLILPA